MFFGEQLLRTMQSSRSAALASILARALTMSFAEAQNACAPPGMPPMPPASRTPPPAYAFIVLLVLNMLSGTFSGLNLGLMSLTVEDLSIIIQGSKNEKEVKWAKKILPLRKRGNLLLCTLLIGNTLVNVMLAILTDPIWTWMFGDGTVGVIFSLLVPTALIVVFGEIIPQAYCGRNSLFIGALSVPLVWVFVIVCYPLCKPIAMILDVVLGREISNVLSRHELLELVTLNVDSEAHAKESGLTKEDGKLLKGALTFKDRTVGDVMTPFGNCFCLSDRAVLDGDVLMQILARGHTRIPVYSGDKPSNITAILFIKDLIGVGFERKAKLSDVLASFNASKRIVRVPKATKLNIAMDHCKRTHTHLLLICEDEPNRGADSAKSAHPARVRDDAPVIGVATMEDFIEELIQDEIVDETDAWHYDRQEETMAEGSTTSKSFQVKKVAVKSEQAVDLTVHLQKMTGLAPPASAPVVSSALGAPSSAMEA